MARGELDIVRTTQIPWKAAGRAAREKAAATAAIWMFLSGNGELLPGNTHPLCSVQRPVIWGGARGEDMVVQQSNAIPVTDPVERHPRVTKPIANTVDDPAYWPR